MFDYFLEREDFKGFDLLFDLGLGLNLMDEIMVHMCRNEGEGLKEENKGNIVILEKNWMELDIR